MGGLGWDDLLEFGMNALAPNSDESSSDTDSGYGTRSEKGKPTKQSHPHSKPRRRRSIRKTRQGTGSIYDEATSQPYELPDVGDGVWSHCGTADQQNEVFRTRTHKIKPCHHIEGSCPLDNMVNTQKQLRSMHYWDGPAKEDWANGLVNDALEADIDMEAAVADMRKEGIDPNLWWDRDRPPSSQPIPPVRRPSIARRASRKKPPIDRRNPRVQNAPQTPRRQSLRYAEAPPQAEVRQAPIYRPAASQAVSDLTVPLLTRRKSAVSTKAPTAAPAPARRDQYRDPTPPPLPPDISSPRRRPLATRKTTYRSNTYQPATPLRYSAIHTRPYALPPLPYGKSSTRVPSTKCPGTVLEYLYPLDADYVPSEHPLAYRRLKPGMNNVLQPISDWQEYRRPYA